MSSATISPPGPEPLIVVRSTLPSLASRRAFGETRISMFGFGVAGSRFGVPWFGGSEVSGACDPGTMNPEPGTPNPEPAADASGAVSPGCSSHAMVCPTGMTAPSRAVTAERMPSPGASTSTTALSVSISASGSPFLTVSPSFFRHDRSFPVSCANSNAGITTLKAMPTS